MKPVILGKNLLSDFELMTHSRDPMNCKNLSIPELREVAMQSALISSMAIIKMTRPGVFAEISAQNAKSKNS